MSIDYTTFLNQKRLTAAPVGFEVALESVNPMLFDHQRDIVTWACRRGRAAVFADTGLGKTFIEAEWGNLVAQHTGGKVLFLAPLAVAQQTIREAAKLGISITYVRSQAEAEAAGPLVITNYDMIKAFDPTRFVGVILDESSILKAYSGATKKLLLKMFADTLYRLAATATPAPNDHIELGNHADFLGVMPSHEMLARWFINDSMKAENYRLKGHARADFWRWVTGWAVCVGKPSDLGYSDDGFRLPRLWLIEHLVTVDQSRAFEAGRLFVEGNQSATSLWSEKRATAEDRCAMAAGIVQAEPGETWIVWCDTNDEADRLKSLLAALNPVEVRGSDKLDEKERKLLSFIDGTAKILITKADIAGFGLNLQHCARQVFVGVTYSFEKLYQALRRSYRFGQIRPVEAHLIYADTEGNVMETIKRKQQDHAAMQAEMTEAQRLYGDIGQASAHLALAPAESDIACGDAWTLYLGDCVQTSQQLPAESVDFSIFSPPFSNLYVYSDREEDMGNVPDNNAFFQHFGYLLPELWRITRPGRLCAVHCKDLPTYKNRDGAAGLYDFPGELVRAFESHGWQFHSRVTIWKDPVIEAARTNNHGLLFHNFSERAEVCRQGMADYMLIFRKHTEEMPAKQVQQRRTPGDYIGTNPPKHYKDERDYAIQVWQRYASPVWFDIDQTDVLNFQIARENEDEKHICPLQLGVIRRSIDLWTNPGDVVFSPFAGVGSEGYVALEMGRQFVGIELKRAYWQLAQRYLIQAELASGQGVLFPELMGRAA